MTNEEKIAKIIEEATAEIAGAIREASSPDYITVQFDKDDLIVKEIGYGLHHIASAIEGLTEVIAEVLEEHDQGTV